MASPSVASGSNDPAACRLHILPDGRTLSYAESGRPAGRPLFYFHGFPGSRLEVALADKAAVRAGFRVIALDRPGIGGSTCQKGRGLLDWPRDVAAFADAIGFDRISILGVSGGAPYALACAVAIPGRLSAVEIVSGLGLIDGYDATRGMWTSQRLLLEFARRAPRLLPIWVGLLSLLLISRPEQLLKHVSTRLAKCDRDLLMNGSIRGVLAGSLRESMKQGSRGPRHELEIYTRPWGFNLNSIRFPTSHWHGEQDRIVPVAMGRRMAEMVPGSCFRVAPDEGHFSLILNRADEILAAMRT